MNAITGSGQPSAVSSAASGVKPFLNRLSNGYQTNAALPRQIIGVANAVARAFPTAALAATPTARSDTAANPDQSNQVAIAKSTEGNVGGQFNVNWDLNKFDSKASDELSKGPIRNS